MQPSPTPVYPPHDLGRRGEAMAAAYLEARGWRILARNHRFGRREVDLVIRGRGILAFVEVKTRGGGGYGHPAEAVTRLKRREIEAVARHWLTRHPPGNVDVRFDAVCVWIPRGGGGVRIEHLEDAWRPGWR